MDYTAIGAEANLAARLQSIAEPGHIVISYETYVLVRDIVAARALPAISVKGIGRMVVPYVVEGVLDEAGREDRDLQRTHDRPRLLPRSAVVKSGDAARVRSLLENALASLKPA